MGRLTTHVLDTANGTPGEGIEITLFRQTSDGFIPIARTLTNQDGRTDSPFSKTTISSLANINFNSTRRSISSTEAPS